MLLLSGIARSPTFRSLTDCDVPPQALSDTEVLEEHPGSDVEAKITATDADHVAKLEYTIDWDATIATKDNQKVDPSSYKKYVCQ